jgi:hypothetical protein
VAPVSAIAPLHYPQAGCYVVVRNPGFVPWVIRAATRSWADHALITTDDQGTIVEALPGGVRMGHLSEYVRCRMAVNTEEPATAAMRRNIAAAAIGMVGVPYDDLAIADDGLDSLGWHWKWLAERAAGEHELICSALCVLAGRAAGLDWLCNKPDPLQVTPGDLQRRPYVREWSIFF